MYIYTYMHICAPGMARRLFPEQMKGVGINPIYIQPSIYIHLSDCLPIYLSIFIHAHKYPPKIYIYIYLSIYLYIYIYISTHLVWPDVSAWGGGHVPLIEHLSIYLSDCLSIDLHLQKIYTHKLIYAHLVGTDVSAGDGGHVPLIEHLSIYLYLSIYLSDSLYIQLSIYLCTRIHL